MKKLMISLAGLLLALPMYADTVTLRLFNTDDTLKARITNSAGTNIIATNNFLQDQTFDITSDITAGANHFDFLLTNTQLGYTWGIDLFQNGTLVFHSQCGTVNVLGCNDNDLTQFTDRIVASADIPPVPEPSAILLLGSGLTIAGARFRRVLPRAMRSLAR